MVHYLTEELVGRGNEVTLFATGDSITAAKLESVFDEQMPDRIGETLYDVRQVAACLRRADEFDIIHDHSGFAGVAFAELVDTPVVHTLHGPFTHDICGFYQEFRDSAHYVSISDYQRSCCPDLQHAGTVYNPIDVEGWPYRGRDEKEDYLLAFGRLCEDKGFHTAIEVAKRTGERLVIAGAIQHQSRDYYETMVKPHVDGEHISFVGEVTLTEKWNLFSKAKAFLFPIQWPEPFGLVMIEAMAAGTPVIAFPEGSVPEVVADGRSGFLVPDADGMVDAIGRIDSIDPAECRRHVQENFSVSKCTDGYEKIYRKILEC